MANVLKVADERVFNTLSVLMSVHLPFLEHVTKPPRDFAESGRHLP